MNKIEILAPAGSLESMKAAVNAGCDAVYIGGGRFGARAYAKNPEMESLIAAIDYMHLRRKKLYLTVNTLCKEKELEEELFPFLLPYYEAGVDAVIVQDAGVMKYIHEYFPKLALHASTQMTLTGEQGANRLKPYGATRFVPARELSLKEIRLMREGTDLEIECFVHGALCYCYSGQCLLSSMIGGRSGNRGRCAQPCRLAYEDPLNGEKAYFLSPKDMCTLQLIPDMIEAGIDSFKIEGRMKGPEYAALCTYLYGKYSRLYLEKGREGFARFQKDQKREWEADQRALAEIYNRGGFSTGYYRDYHGKHMMSFLRPNHYGVLAGKVTRVEKGRAQICLSEDIHAQDTLEFRDKKERTLYDYTVGKNALKGDAIEANFKIGSGISAGCRVFRIKNAALMHKIKEQFLLKEKKPAVQVSFLLKEGEPFTLRFSCGEITAAVFGPAAEPAQNRPLTKKNIEDAIGKLNDTPFTIKGLEGEISRQAFLPAKAVKQLRREAVRRLTEDMLFPYRRNADKIPEKKRQEQRRESGERIKPAIHALVSNERQWEEAASLKEVDRIYAPWSLILDKKCKAAGKEIYAALPYIFRRNTFEAFLNHNWDGCDGFLIRNYEQLAFVKEITGKAITADSNLYTYNSYARAFFLEQGVFECALPLELNKEEIKERGVFSDPLIVYGHAPLMISAQCLTDNRKKCVRRSGWDKLIDRKGKALHVFHDCECCYNVIYDGEAFSLLSEKKALEELGVSALRLDFTWEEPEEMRKILKNFSEVFRYNKSIGKIESASKGHFNRGVE